MAGVRNNTTVKMTGDYPTDLFVYKSGWYARVIRTIFIRVKPYLVERIGVLEFLINHNAFIVEIPYSCFTWKFDKRECFDMVNYI